MARALISLLGLLAICFSSGQSFGRFGFSDLPSVPGFVLTAEGFKVRQSAADTFKFFKPLDLKRTSATSESAAYKSPPYALTPQNVKVNLRSPGFEMYFPYGMELRLSSINAPILTTGPASYGAETPAPPAKWILVTFSDLQPPILLVFLDAQSETIVTGRSGEWKLKTTQPFAGWIRVCLPFGTKAVSANGVGTLGSLSKDIAHREFLWTQAAPVLKSTLTQVENGAVTYHWTFDKGGALVPPALALARLGGAQVEAITPIADLGISTEEGPVLFVRGPTLTVKFMMRQALAGRPLTVGKPELGEFTHISSPTLAMTAEATLMNLTCWRDREWVVDSRASLDEYFSRILFREEPISKVKVPYEADGTGMDTAAVNALLMSSGMPIGGENSLLTNLAWRLDPMTWRLWSPQPDTSRRSAALCVLAGALDESRGSRALAAMLQCGLAAETQHPKFSEETGQVAPSVSTVEPLASLRRFVFSKDLPASDEFLRTFSSPAKILSGQPVTLVDNKGKLKMYWLCTAEEPGPLIVECENTVEINHGANIKSISRVLKGTKSVLQFEPIKTGLCSCFVKVLNSKVSFPKSVLPPKYAE